VTFLLRLSLRCKSAQEPFNCSHFSVAAPRHVYFWQHIQRFLNASRCGIPAQRTGKTGAAFACKANDSN
jgi:hypothetical protein